MTRDMGRQEGERNISVDDGNKYLRHYFRSMWRLEEISVRSSRKINAHVPALEHQ